MKNKQSVTIKHYFELIKNWIFDNFQNSFALPGGLLKYPYIDPAAQYSKNLWDWDSFWASTALFKILEQYNDKRVQDYKETIFLHTAGSLLNFFEHQSKEGVIPISMTPDNDDVFRCKDKKKKDETNMAKPVFGQFLLAVTKETKNLSTAKQVFDKLLLFYDCYRKYYLHKKTGLFMWGSDMAIGVDDDPSTWGRPHFSSINIFLNCLMYKDLVNSAQVADMLNKTNISNKLKNEAEELKKAILKYCWDERDGFFYSVDCGCEQRLLLSWINKNLTPFWDVLPLKVMGWPGFMPLWSKIASGRQVHRMVKEHLLNEKQFYSPYGIRSLSKDEKMYSPEIARGNPSNWLGPIWIITNYMVYEGLKNYSYVKEANELSDRIVLLLGKDIEKNGAMHEYYSPETGKGIIGKGFLNWNMFVLCMRKY